MPLAADTALRLSHVHATKLPHIQNENDWFAVMGDLAQKRLLLYRNGADGYDVHPLLRAAVDAAAKAAAAAATAAKATAAPPVNPGA